MRSRFVRASALASALALVTAVVPSVRAVEPTDESRGLAWQRLDPRSMPSARRHFGLAYDSARDRLVLFGGGTIGPTANDDTWVFDGTDWSFLGRAPEDLGRRRMPAMAYDEARDEIILFGGEPYEGGRLDETWALVGDTWEQRHPAHSPPPTLQPMVYDPIREQMVLVVTEPFAYRDPMQTWVWDGVDWTFMGAGPPGSIGYNLAWDERRGAVVLGGGLIQDGERLESWAWNGTRWSELPTGPSGAFYAMGSTADRVIRFGGHVRGTFLRDTWKLGAHSWTKVADRGPRPSARIDAGMAYDPVRDQTYLVMGLGRRRDGSYKVLDDMWVLSPS